MRVEQNSGFFSDFVRMVCNGYYGLAPFQRNYVWNKEDVESLMKSILNRWPIGSFTVWEPKADERDRYQPRSRFGPLEIDAGQASGVVLDGQNRLSTLLYAMFAHESPENPEFPYSDQERLVWLGDEVLVADADARDIKFMHKDAAWSATSMPLGVVLRGTMRNNEGVYHAYQKFMELGGTDENLNWLYDDLTNHFREARIVMTNLQNASLDEALDCYMTICRAGQPITDQELEDARSFGKENASYRP